MFPCIAVGVGEVQTALNLLQTNAVSAMIGRGLGIIGILYSADQLRTMGTDVDMDKRFLGRANAMLESILYQRDENHRSHLYATRRLLGVEENLYGFWQSDAHQLDIVFQKLYLLLERYHGFLVVVQDVAHHLRQFLNGLLCLGSVECSQRIDVVQGVEQEVGVNLVAQVT